MKVLYFDTFSGISGDMTVASLLDLGVDFEYFKSQITTLDISGYLLSLEKKNIDGIMVSDFDVVLTAHHHEHRGLWDIKKIIVNSKITGNAKNIAMKIFTRLAMSESRVHGVSVDEIHFHEVGAVDSIIDIVGVAICIDKLGVEAVFYGDLPVFFGEINCAHGLISLPAPAVADLTSGLIFSGEPENGELVTPTGAAILTAVGHQVKILTNIKSACNGYGAGKKKFTRPNYLKVTLGEIKQLDKIYRNKLLATESCCLEKMGFTSKFEYDCDCDKQTYKEHKYINHFEDFHKHTSDEKREIVQIEFNIDDMNPELYENLLEELFDAGALDAFMTNVVMKKSRTGVVVTVISPYELLDKMSEVIFKNSTTIGIRYHKKDRICLEREIIKMDTIYGKIRVKNTIFKGEIINSKPEYEDCKAVAKAEGISLKEVYNSILKN